MKPTIPISLTDNRKASELIEFECLVCGGKFKRKWQFVKSRIKLNPQHNNFSFCCKKCQSFFLNKRISFKCQNCNADVKRNGGEITKNKTGRFYCSHACAAIYNNAHKTHGTRRSKLETYIENQLINLFPSLEIHFNRKDAILSELDIYVPNLKLAFELNGIFHYEPIYGEDKLNQIKNNDGRKFQACLERGIELCIIDSSKLEYFKEKNAKPYLDIITEIINQKLVPLCRIARPSSQI